MTYGKTAMEATNNAPGNVIRLTVFVVFPIYLGIAAVAKDLVLVMWGVPWLASVQLIQFFCWSGCIQALCFPVGWVYLARGQSNALARWGVLGNSILILSIVAGIATGNVQGLVIAYLIGNLIVFFPCQKLGLFYIELKVRDILKESLKPALMAILMFGVVWFIGQNMMTDWPRLTRLIILVLTGVGVYVSGSFFLCRPLISDIFEILGKKQSLSSTVRAFDK